MDTMERSLRTVWCCTDGDTYLLPPSFWSDNTYLLNKEPMSYTIVGTAHIHNSLLYTLNNNRVAIRDGTVPARNANTTSNPTSPLKSSFKMELGQHAGFNVYYPPLPPTVHKHKSSVILYGSIEQGPANWHTEVASHLSDLPVAILNPHRHDWDDSWVEDISCSKFKEQVEWEMDHAQVADVIAFHFGPATLAPISLLELGMYAASGKVVVHCDQDFKKKGNVQIVCSRFGIRLVYRLDELKEIIREILEEKLSVVGRGADNHST